MKSENHSCSIELFKYILRNINEDENIVEVVERLKKKRKESQYYPKEVKISSSELKEFIEYDSSLKNKILLQKQKLRKNINELIEVANKEDF